VRQLRLGLAQGLLRPLALDALADLAAEGRHQGDQVRGRVPDRLAEPLDDAQDGTSPPSTMEKPQTACSPASAARGARSKPGSWTTSGMQTGAWLA